MSWLDSHLMDDLSELRSKMSDVSDEYSELLDSGFSRNSERIDELRDEYEDLSSSYKDLVQDLEVLKVSLESDLSDIEELDLSGWDMGLEDE